MVDSVAEDESWVSPPNLKQIRHASRELPEHPKTPKTPKTPRTPQMSGGGRGSGNAAGPSEYDRDAALQSELEGIRHINSVIEGTIATLEKMRTNMDVVNGTVNNSSTLLDTWTRILSQTEHNQRLILNPEWKGATQDLADLEAEAIRAQEAAQRRAYEEELRREAARQKAEDEERARIARESAPPATRGATRGLRSRVGVRGGVTRGSKTAMTRGVSSVRGVTREATRGVSTGIPRSGAVNARGTSTSRGIPRGTSSARSRGTSSTARWGA